MAMTSDQEVNTQLDYKIGTKSSHATVTMVWSNQ